MYNLFFFHVIYPCATSGVSGFGVVLYCAYNQTQRVHYNIIHRVWGGSLCWCKMLKYVCEDDAFYYIVIY